MDVLNKIKDLHVDDFFHIMNSAYLDKRVNLTKEWEDLFNSVGEQDAGTPMKKEEASALLAGIQHLDEEVLKDYLDAVDHD